MSNLYVLYEHATGYALFHTNEFEELTVLTPQVEQTMLEISKFRSAVELVAFRPFEDSENALENMNSVSEGILHSDLSLFLETNVPKSKKKKKQPVVLGVAEPKLAGAIVEALDIPCLCTGVVPEVIRGIRAHFHHLVKNIDAAGATKAQIGLGHSYSRAKIKFNVNLVDNMIIQSISLMDQLDKDINTFAMRVREWYSYHFPELIKILPEYAIYVQAVAIIKDRKDMNEDVVGKLEELLNDSTKVQNILDVARTSMGMDISPIDLANIETFCSRVSALIEYRRDLFDYVKTKMNNIAPNLSTLIGETVGARLISHAGSLNSLAKYPASTVQILGAEKALFRALKTKSATPKYGLIFHSTFIGRAAKQNKGRISRYLANKCSIASRVDCFSEIPTDVFGKYLKQQVEDRLKFYDSGATPSKNIDIMEQAVAEASTVQEQILKKKKKKEKKEKKRKLEEMSNNIDSSGESEVKKEKKIKVEADVNGTDDVVQEVKKKKKKKQKQEILNDGLDVDQD